MTFSSSKALLLEDPRLLLRRQVLLEDRLLLGRLQLLALATRVAGLPKMDNAMGKCLENAETKGEMLGKCWESGESRGKCNGKCWENGESRGKCLHND